MKIINESLDFMDMEGQLSPTVTVDEYVAKMGDDSDIVTLAFTVNSQLVADDLVTWLERGYDFVLDASVSDGEIETGKWLVFVELDRRLKVPERICLLLSDLETLTGLKLTDWTVEIDGDPYEADEDIIGNAMVLNPGEYRAEKEPEEDDSGSDSEELNEFRELAGLEPETNYVDSEYTRHLKSMAGI